MDKQKEKLTMEHLSALYWLKVLDEFDECEELDTLVEKYQNFENEPQTDEEENEREQLDNAVRELIELDYVKGKIENDVITWLEFTPKAMEIINKIEDNSSLEKIMNQINREANFKKIAQILYENRGLIVEALVGIFFRT